MDAHEDPRPSRRAESVVSFFDSPEPPDIHEILERNTPEITHRVEHYPREAFLYWLAAWNHNYANQEQLRGKFGLPPWMQFKTAEELEAMGINIVEQNGVTVVKKLDS